MWVLLYAICCFSLVAVNILSLIFVSLITVSQYVPPWLYPAWDSLCFLPLVDYFLFHGSVQLLALQILSRVFSVFSFWDFYNANVHLMLSQRSLRLSSFFSPMFCFVAVISTIQFSRSLIHSSPSYSSVDHSSVLFISVCLFSFL